MKKLDTSRIKTYSLKDRPSKVRLGDFAKPHRPGASFKDFFSSLPNILGARHLKDVVAALVQARRDQRPVMLGMGAHSIKVGLSPVIIDLMERGIITSLSLNGAGIIHDFELAFVGQTSEDVDKEILSGAFGMAE
jgi:deoxyhypusine synthase